MANKMQAVRLTSPGGPENLELARVDLPWPAAEGDVLVRLEFAALNPADAYFRQFGPYIDDAGPCILGHDGYGVVEQVGGAVSRLRPGQRVCFCHGGIGGAFGTYAEFAVLPESRLAPVPDSVDDHSAAGLPLVFITAWESLYERAAVAAGEYVLVHAGAGGTGHVALQLAVLRGARVATTVSTEAKIELASQLGAERPIAYRNEDYAAAAMAWSDGGGVAVALDNLGAEAFRKTISIMAPYGRLVTLMGTPGDDDSETAYINNLTIHNVMMLTPMILGLQAKLDHQAGIVAEGLKLLQQGKLRLHVDSVFALRDIGEAHRQLDSGSSTGKILLSING